MSVRAVGRSDVGKERSSNEDALHLDHDLGLYIVCDGMGGHAAGEVASSTAARVAAAYIAERRGRLEEMWRETELDGVCGLVSEAVREACREVHRLAQAVPQFGKMGTTLTMLAVAPDERRAVMGHVGDSRLYRLRGGELEQISYDHNHANELVRVGAITEEAARKHPYARYLSRAVGLHETVEVETEPLELASGDTYLLCSDGLTTHVGEAEELRERLAGAEVDGVVGDLVDRALELGGRDNISVIVVRIAGEARSRRAGEAGMSVDALRKVFLFSELDAEALEKLIEVAELRDAQAGETLVHEGEQCTRMRFVLSGRYRVRRAGRVVDELAPGDVMGALGLFEAHPALGTLEVVEDGQVLAIDAKPFAELLRSDRASAVRIYQSLAREIQSRLEGPAAA